MAFCDFLSGEWRTTNEENSYAWKTSTFFRALLFETGWSCNFCQKRASKLFSKAKQKIQTQGQSVSAGVQLKSCAVLTSGESVSFSWRLHSPWPSRPQILRNCCPDHCCHCLPNCCNKEASLNATSKTTPVSADQHTSPNHPATNRDLEEPFEAYKFLRLPRAASSSSLL